MYQPNFYQDSIQLETLMSVYKYSRLNILIKNPRYFISLPFPISYLRNEIKFKSATRLPVPFQSLESFNDRTQLWNKSFHSLLHVMSAGYTNQNIPLGIKKHLVTLLRLLLKYNGLHLLMLQRFNELLTNLPQYPESAEIFCHSSSADRRGFE